MESLFKWVQNQYTVQDIHCADALPRFCKTDLRESLPEARIFHKQNGDWLFSPSFADAPFVSSDAQYRNINLFTEPDNTNSRIQQSLLRIAFESRFCYKGIISLHAACIESDGCAIAFTGPSGAGKSTRANAWIEALGAKLISGDKPAIRLTEAESYACGVPWDGKEQFFRDVEIPLKCILEVRRSPANYIRKLTNDQALKLIIQQSFVPVWDTEAAMRALANANKLIETAPVYRVFCGPDTQDAKAIHDILFNHPERIWAEEEIKEMKIKEGFILRNVANEYIVMAAGKNMAQFDGAIILNEISAFLFGLLEHPMSREDLLAALLNEYDVDEATASADLDEFLSMLSDIGVLAE